MNNETRTTVVWIVNEAGHSYQPALEIAGPDAELKPLTLGNINILQIDRLAYTLANGIVRYTHRDDFILISGSPIISGLALPIWLRHHGQAKVLQWDAKRREYKLATLTTAQLDSMIERELQRT